MKSDIYNRIVSFEEMCRNAWNDVDKSDRDILKKTILFVSRYVAFAYENGVVLDVPDIGSGPDGSIDVHWCTPKYELLVNVKRSEQVTFYGDDYGECKIKGSFDIKEINQEFLKLWSLT